MPFGRLRRSFVGSAPGVKYNQTKPKSIHSCTANDENDGDYGEDEDEEFYNGIPRPPYIRGEGKGD
jgi:hypothetical protein